MSASDTIAALSTPWGHSGLAVVRLSGPACLRVVAHCLSSPSASSPLPISVTKLSALPPVESHRMRHGVFRAWPSGEILDRLNWVYMAAPRTSTGEDVLELFPHGNPLIVRRMLEVLGAIEGVRMAGPGEFTRRAFEHGKMDLVQAESVGQLIHAQSLAALQNAQRILAGGLSETLRGLRDKLAELSVRLELDVDFAEEEADPDYASWRIRLESISTDLENLAATFSRGQALGHQPRVALVGAPNAGKSSLINALVGEDRLLVSARPGTTRDYVEVPLPLPGGIACLVDTAGLGEAVDELDAAAMERSRSWIRRADLVLLVHDGADTSSDTDTDGAGSPGREDNGKIIGSSIGSSIGKGGGIDSAALEAQSESTLLRVRTKSDLPGFSPAEGWLAISSLSGAGLLELRQRLDAALFSDRPGAEEILLGSERQHQAVRDAQARVEAAIDNLRVHPAVEIIAFEIREAVRHLHDLLGELSPDEVLARIFSGFCIGK